MTTTRGAAPAGPMARELARLQRENHELRRQPPAARQPAPVRPLPIEDMIGQAVRQALASRNNEIAGLQKFREETVRNEQTRAVDAILERLSRAGKVPPRDVPGERAILLSLDTRTVHKFSEDGKEVSGTQLDLYVRNLERRPSLFSDAPKSGTEEAASDERKKVEEHVKTHIEFFNEKAGISVDQMLAAFDAQRKRDPKLTAEKFLNPAKR